MGMRFVTHKPDNPSGSGARSALANGVTTPAGKPSAHLRRWLVRHLPVRLWQRPQARRWLVAGAFYVALLAIVLVKQAPEIIDLQVGQVAPVDVMAPRDVVDRYRTDRLREEAARQAIRDASQDPSNFEINPAVALQAEESAALIFQILEQRRQELQSRLQVQVTGAAEDEESAPQPGEAEPLPASPTGQESPGDGENQPGHDRAPAGHLAEQSAEPAPQGAEPAWTPPAVSQEDVEAVTRLLNERTAREWENEFVEMALKAPPDVFAQARQLAVRAAPAIHSRQRISVADVEAVRRDLPEMLREMGVDPEVRALAEPVLAAVVTDNLILNPEKLERARQEAIRNVQDVVVREGQIIVRRGDPVEVAHIQLLRDLGMLERQRPYGQWLGTALLLLLLFALVGLYGRQFLPELVREDRLMALLGLVLLLVSGMARIAAVIPWNGAVFLVPVALASMLVSLLIDSRLGMVVTLFLAAIVGMVSDGELNAVIIALSGGLAGIFSVSKISQRSDLTRAGFIIGGVCTVTMVALGLAQSQRFLWEYAFLGIINGLVAAVATIGLLPYLEDLFGITSTLRLLELSNPNQPLLRKLLMEAPGSYHHSIIVGNLSEAAAEAIGADSLLVRVGSLYHDVGKTKRPYFFAENQFGAENPHDKISPTLSTLIITSHVKDGVELAREHNLPEVLVRFIREHHGTALVKYFYQKALEMAKGEPVDEKDFRYQGPKPQSRETAIVMLADSVEAAVRSLSQPTPGRIEGLVRKIIKEKLADGELDESDLTLRDLDKIADAFVRVLTGIFHKRVEYPELTLPEAERKTG